MLPVRGSKIVKYIMAMILYWGPANGSDWAGHNMLLRLTRVTRPETLKMWVSVSRSCYTTCLLVVESANDRERTLRVMTWTRLRLMMKMMIDTCCWGQQGWWGWESAGASRQSPLLAWSWCWWQGTVLLTRDLKQRVLLSSIGVNIKIGFRIKIMD